MNYFFVYDASTKGLRQGLKPLTKDNINWLIRNHGNLIGCNDNDVWRYWIDGEIEYCHNRTYRIAIVPRQKKATWNYYGSFYFVDQRTAVELAEDITFETECQKRRYWKRSSYSSHFPINSGVKQKASNDSEVRQSAKEYQSDILRLKLSRQRNIAKEAMNLETSCRGSCRSWKSSRINQFRG